jgi:co-chaperonin GroES (HSP10)
MKTGYKPQPGYILIKKIETEEKSDGLVFVDDKEKPNAKIGEVVEVGGPYNHEHEPQFIISPPIALQPGVKVVYKKYVDFNFTENGEEYVFIKLEDIIAIKETK